MNAEHPQTETKPARPRPRTSPIVWGAIVLAFCLYSALQLIAPGSVDTISFFITSMIVLGMLLLVGAIAVIARNARNSR